MRNWLKALIGFFVFSCNSQPKLLTESEFTNLYLDSLNKVYPNVNFKIVSDLRVTSTYEGNELIHYLNNPYKEYSSNPNSLSDVIMKYIKSSSETYQGKKAININRIVPIVKPISYLDDLRHMSKENGVDKEPRIVYEIYNDELIIVYGEDNEKSIKYF